MGKIYKSWELKAQKSVEPVEILRSDAVSARIRAFAGVYGYNVSDIWWVQTVGSKYKNLYMDLRSEDRFHPSFYSQHELGSFGEQIKFKVSTVSYGALDSVDYEKYLSACEDAFSLLKYLESLDVNTLPTVLVEDE